MQTLVHLLNILTILSLSLKKSQSSVLTIFSAVDLAELFTENWLRLKLKIGSWVSSFTWSITHRTWLISNFDCIKHIHSFSAQRKEFKCWSVLCSEQIVCKCEFFIGSCSKWYSHMICILLFFFALDLFILNAYPIMMLPKMNGSRSIEWVFWTFTTIFFLNSHLEKTYGFMCLIIILLKWADQMVIAKVRWRCNAFIKLKCAELKKWTVYFYL